MCRNNIVEDVDRFSHLIKTEYPRLLSVSPLLRSGEGSGVRFVFLPSPPTCWAIRLAWERGRGEGVYDSHRAICGENEAKQAAFSGVAFNFDATLMQFGDAPCNRQPQPEALG